jgi:hypothetical protein
VAIFQDNSVGKAAGDVDAREHRVYFLARSFLAAKGNSN